MLKNIIYINPIILLIVILIIRSKISINIKKYNKKNMKVTLIACIIFIIINMFLAYLVHWNNELLGFILFSLIILITSILICIKSFKLINESINIEDEYKLNIFKVILLILFPIINFVLPYLHELYIIKNCNYIFKYESENESLKTSKYITLINNKIMDFSLSKFDDTEIIEYEIEYDIVYKNNDISIENIKNNENNTINTETIKSIANDAKDKVNIEEIKKQYNIDVAYANIKYLINSNYSIITISSKKDSGIILGTFLYNDSNFIMKLKNNPGNIVYYNKK